jgi:hypothetical protein
MLRKKILFTLDKLNLWLGLKFFNNFNLLSYNLFNKIYKKNICNKYYLKYDFISKYANEGFSKLGNVSSNDINDLLKLLNINNNPQPGNDNQYNYSLNENTINLIKKIIDINILDKIRILEGYYNLKIVLANIKVARNYNVPHNDIKKESYSNFFHSDGYLFNLFKIFINLEDIDRSQGPLIIVKKNKAKNFFKFYNYTGRKHCEISKNTESFFYVNDGKKGDILLCDTTELMHKAGEIMENKKRDMLFLEFAAYPLDRNTDIYAYQKEFKNNINMKFSKIAGIKNLINFYFLCKKNKLS